MRFDLVGYRSPWFTNLTCRVLLLPHSGIMRVSKGPLRVPEGQCKNQ